jgi:hypothetical protein
MDVYTTTTALKGKEGMVEDAHQEEYRNTLPPRASLELSATAVANSARGSI